MKQVIEETKFSSSVYALVHTTWSEDGIFNRRHLMGYIACWRPSEKQSFSLLHIRNKVTKGGKLEKSQIPAPLFMPICILQPDWKQGWIFW